MPDTALLRVKNLKKYFPIRGGLFSREVARVHAVDDVSTEYGDPRRDAWAVELLPRLREASTTEVARALGVNVSTVKRWKSGAMRPHPRQVAALAAVLCR